MLNTADSRVLHEALGATRTNTVCRSMICDAVTLAHVASTDELKELLWLIAAFSYCVGATAQLDALPWNLLPPPPLRHDPSN